MRKYGLLFILVIGLMTFAVIAQDTTLTPGTGPIPMTSPTATATSSTQDTETIATPTFVPANGESAVIQGPISTIDNVHAVVEPFTSVIENPELAGQVTPLLINGRTIEIPENWSYTGAPGVAGLPPHILRYEGPGLRFGWDYVNGRAGVAQDGIQLFGNQRYIVRVNYRTDIIYARIDTPYTPSHLQLGARLYTAQNGFTELPPQSMHGTQENHTIEWVIESTANPYPFVRLEVYFLMEYPIFIGGSFLEHVDILTAPTDYRPEFVIQFE
jgi:hypothetical protein